MYIFPMGLIAASLSSGTIDGVSYSMFEPNSKVYSKKNYNILVTAYQNQTLLTRKKSDPFLTIHYDYENIFTREFRQIEHFVEKKEDALNTFFAVDWSAGITPSGIANSSGDWIVSITNTKLYSSTANMKSNRAFVWNGSSFKEGLITSVSTNVSVTVDVDTSNYGNLTLANAQSGGIIYPLYECYLIPGSIGNFESTNFIPNHSISLSEDGGYMYSGSLSLVTKYKV